MMKFHFRLITMKIVGHGQVPANENRRKNAFFKKAFWTLGFVLQIERYRFPILIQMAQIIITGNYE